MTNFIAPLERYLIELVRKHDIPGLAIAVARNGSTVWEAGIGHRDREAGLPASPETVFGIASVTKSFTAMSIMMLQEEGRLSVQDPVIKWLPEFRMPNADWNQQVTIHHLLTHTSGLPPIAAVDHLRAASQRRDPNIRLSSRKDPHAIQPITTCVELLTIMAGMEYELLGPPGAHSSYSNEGYTMLGEIVARAAGRPYTEFVRERIFAPCRMEQTAFRVEEMADFPEVTQLYVYQEGKAVPVPGFWDTAETYSSGAIKSNVRDLTRYLDVYRTGGLAGGTRLISEASVAQMTAPHVLRYDGAPYGYGLVLFPQYGAFGHSGGIKGVSSYVLVSSQQGLTVTVLTNVTDAPTQTAAVGALRATLGMEPQEPAPDYPEVEPAPAEVSRFAGTYQSGEAGQMLFLAEEGRLWLKTAVGPALPMRFVAPDAVLLQGKPARFLSDAGQVWGLAMGSRVLQRVPG